MGLDDTILVVETRTLFSGGYFQGFTPAGQQDYFSTIRENPIWKVRRTVEDNPQFKQPIPYVVLFDPISKTFFAYQRAKMDKRYGEKRLQGKWSWGVGGHIDISDMADALNPVLHAAHREIDEEVHLAHRPELQLFGYLNDDSDAVGKVHFGIVYVARVKPPVTPKDPEIAQGVMKTLEELNSLKQNEIVEDWSRMLLTPLRTHLVNATG